MNSLDIQVISTFFISTIIGAARMAKILFFSGQSISNDLKFLLFKYYFSETIVVLVIYLQLPYKYQLLLDMGYTHSKISEMISYSHLVNAFWNLLYPFISKRIGHRYTIVISIFTYTLASLLFGLYHTFLAYSIANILISITFSTLNRAFHDWWLTEESNLPEENKANIIYNEWGSFINLIISIAVSPTSSYISHHYGIQFLYLLTPGLILCSVPIVISIIVPSKSQEAKSIGNDFSEISKLFSKNNAVSLIIIIEILQGVSLFLSNQRMSAFLITNDHKPMMGFVSGTYAIISLIGAQFLSMFTDYLSNIQWWSLSAVLSGISLVCIYIFYNNKHIVFCLTTLESFLSSILLAIRMEIIKLYFPRSIRGYLVTMCRTPTLLLSYISLKLLITNRIEIFALISGILMIVSSLFGVPFLTLYSNAEVLDSKSKEPKEDNSIQVEEDLEDGYNLSDETTVSL